MQTKASQLKQMMADGDWYKALRMAAKFPKLGDHREAIQLGWSAFSNPSFYRQIRKNPDELIQAGITALKERYL